MLFVHATTAPSPEYTYIYTYPRIGFVRSCLHWATNQALEAEAAYCRGLNKHYYYGSIFQIEYGYSIAVWFHILYIIYL